MGLKMNISIKFGVNLIHIQGVISDKGVALFKMASANKKNQRGQLRNGCDGID